MPAPPPILFFAFSNDRSNDDRYLRNLPEELRRIREQLRPAEEAGLCEVIIRSNTTLDELLDVFQQPGYRGRIALFHFGGHAGDAQLFLESATGHPELAHAEGLAGFLGRQRSIQLVFFNGCSTQPQVEGLLDAGVPAVIATSEAIEDATASTLSERFYQGLCGGLPLKSAYEEAVAAVKTRAGSIDRATRGERRHTMGHSDRWPWDWYARPGAEGVEQWSLPKAAGNPLFGLPALPAMDLPESPYRFLQWFQREHAPVFFGRGNEIRELYERISDPSSAPIVLFYGATGVGKSSLLSAGLLPRLEQTHWVRYARRDATRGLAGTLHDTLGLDGKAASIASAWRGREVLAEQPLVVFLDQLEEVYTRPAGADELPAFLDALTDLFLVRDRRPRGKLVLSFRKEWLADIKKKLQERGLPRTEFFLERLQYEGVLDVVEGPTSTPALQRQYRLEIEPALPALIADDLFEDQESALAPTLQILLSKMWSEAGEASPPRFTVARYLELKTQGLLLDDFLTEQMAALAGRHPEIVSSGLALDLLARHTTPLGTAQSCTGDRLVEAYADRRTLLAPLLASLSELYLLVLDAGADGIPTRSRLAHDTLAPLVLARRKGSDAPGQRAARVLENRMTEWREGKEGAPLDEADLETVEAGAAGMHAWDGDERRLVETSRRAVARQRRFRKRVRQGSAVVAVLIGVLAIVASYQWWRTGVEAERARRSEMESFTRFLSGRSLASDNPSLRALLTIQSTREAARLDSTHFVSDPQLALAALRDGYPMLAQVHYGHRNLTPKLAFSPDERWFASASLDSTVRLLDLETREERVLNHPQMVSYVAFSPDTTRLVTATVSPRSLRGWLYVWNLASGTVRDSIAMDHAGVLDAVFLSANRLATLANQESISIWDLDTHQQTIVVDEQYDEIFDLAFDASTRQLRYVDSGSDNTLYLVNIDSLTTQEVDLESIDSILGADMTSMAFLEKADYIAFATDDHIVRLLGFPGNATRRNPPFLSRRQLTGHSAEVTAIAFGPDEDVLATASKDGSLRVWDLDKPDEPGRVLNEPGADTILAIAYSPKGRYVGAGYSDRSVRLWDLDHNTYAQHYEVSGMRTLSVAVSPDRRWIAAGEQYHVIRLWDRESGDVRTLDTRGGSVHALAFSPDSRQLAAGAYEGDIQLFDLQTNTATATLPGHERAVVRLAYSPDGRALASAAEDGTVVLRNPRDTTSMPIVMHRHTSAVFGLAFSPDGNQLASSSADRTIRFWDTRTGIQIDSLVSDTGELRSIAFSPEGKRIAYPLASHAISIRDLESASEVRQLTGPNQPIIDLAFTPDGKRLVAASGDKSVRVWDLDTGEETLRIIEKISLENMALGPDGTWAAVATAFDGIHEWDLNPLTRALDACPIAGRNFTVEEWRSFMGSRPYACTCPQFGPGVGIDPAEAAGCAVSETGGVN